MLREDKRIVPDQIEHFLPLGLEWWTTCQHVEEQDAKSPPRKPLISILYERSTQKVAANYSNWFSLKDLKTLVCFDQHVFSDCILANQQMCHISGNSKSQEP